MIGYCLRRLLQGVLLVWAAATVVFLLAEAAPGDPFSATEDISLDPARARALREWYGLEKPALERYGRWLASAAQGDWGISLRARRPVAERIAEALPFSALLGFVSVLLAVVAGGALGLLQTRLKETRRLGPGLERGIDRSALLLYCLPTFWVGLGLIDLFAYRLGWFPPSHLQPPGSLEVSGMGALAHWVLPTCTLALVPAAAIARHLRASLLSAASEQYVRAARARGAGAYLLLGRHRLRACLGPVLALVGLHLPYMAGGALLVEVVFSLPGMGRLAYEATLAHDYPLLMANAVLVSVAVVSGSVMADLLQMLVDPRLRPQPERSR